MDPSKPTKKQLRTLTRLSTETTEYGYDGYVMLVTGHAFVSIAKDQTIKHHVVDRDGRELDRVDAKATLRHVASLIGGA